MFGDCVPLLFIDDSTRQGQEEEGYYYEEEEENFNHLSNQGKLILATKPYQDASYTCKITPLRPNPSFTCKLSFYFFIKAHYLEYLENCRIVVEGSIKSIKLGLGR